jgi:excinuclease UvrABC nuclease subunit
MSYDENDDDPYGEDFAPGDAKSIDQLRREQDQAVSAMDFERADEIDREIKAINDRAAGDTVRSFLGSFDADCERVRQRHRARRQEILNARHREEAEIRERFSDAFVSEQCKQQKQLREFEQRQFEIFKALLAKPMPKVENMAARAIQAGKDRKYEEAKQLRDDAEAYQRRKLAKRTEAFEASNKAAANKLLDEQRQALQALTAAMQRELAIFEAARAVDLRAELQEYRQALDREFVRKGDSARVRRARVEIGADGRSVASDGRSAAFDARTAPSDARSAASRASAASVTSAVLSRELRVRYDEILTRFGLSTEKTEALTMAGEGASRAGMSQASGSSRASARQRR